MKMFLKILKVLKAIFGVLFYIGFFVIAPRVIYSLASAKIPKKLIHAIGIEGSILTATVIGIALAVLLLVKTFTAKDSVVNVIAVSASLIASFCAFLFIVGLGRPITFGKPELDILGFFKLGLDLRVIVYVVLVLLLVRLGATLLGFLLLKREAGAKA